MFTNREEFSIMPWFDTYGDDKVWYDDGETPWANGAAFASNNLRTEVVTSKRQFLCGLSYDGAGRPCAYRHRHRFRIAAWLCGLWYRGKDDV